jgi:hypothetical protein
MTAIDSLSFSIGFLNTFEVGLSNTEVVVFPNPSNQKNTIEFVDAIPENTTICLYDITGRRIQNVFSGEIQKNAMIEVDISMLSSGIYLYSISNSSMKTNLKFIKN